MPRTDRVEFTFAVPFLKVRDGTTSSRLSALPMALSRRVSWLATLTASGTFCRFSDRFCAVTMTSATVSGDVAAAAARAGCAAKAPPMRATDAADNSRLRVIPCFI